MIRMGAADRPSSTGWRALGQVSELATMRELIGWVNASALRESYPEFPATALFGSAELFSNSAVRLRAKAADLKNKSALGSDRDAKCGHLYE